MSNMRYTAYAPQSVVSEESMTPLYDEPAPAQRPTYQEGKYPCTKADCMHLSATEDDMKRHKRNDPEHFYCYKCDFDAEDWEELTSHKVENMAPYVEGIAGQCRKLDGLLKHITCEFCGQDFRSFGGRKRHRQQAHPADQDVTCPGCEHTFIRASHMVEHLEKGECGKISARDFRTHMNQKYIVGQIMAAPDKFGHPKTIIGKPAVSSSTSSSRPVTDGDESLDQDPGGVSLLDQQDDAQRGGVRPLEAEENLINLNPQPKHEEYPRLPGQKPSLAESLRSMSIRSGGKSTSKKSSGGVSLGGSTSNRSTGRMYEESYPYTSSQDDYDDTASESTVTSAEVAGSTPRTASAWGTNSTAQTLFPKAKPTPRPQPKAGDWDGILAHRTEEAEADDSGNMMKIAWWDPSSKDYDASRFFYEGSYYCPFPACDDAIFGNAFAAQSDIEGHIKYCHTRTKYRCSWCFKHFQSVAGLVAHVESTRKCGIKESNGFKKFLDEISGGFLKAKRVAEPKIYRPEKALVKAGQAIGGISSTRFTGKDPHTS